MGEDVKYEATLLIQRQDEMDSNEYLLQVDVEGVKGGRIFIPLNRMVLSITDGSFPKNKGEYFYDSNKSEVQP